MPKIVAISDVHCKWDKLIIPPCDILISAGDYSFKGEKSVVKDFHKWLNKQEANHIISVQGNHELWVQDNFTEAKEIALKECPAVHFVEHESIDIEGIKIFGSAWSPFFFNWAFNGARSINEQLQYSKRSKLIPLMKDLWKEIPLDTNILVSHGMPYTILDELHHVDGSPKGQFVGCQDLLNKISTLENLDIFIGGHLHSAHGQKHINGVSYYNTSICDELYTPSNPVTIIEYNKG